VLAALFSAALVQSDPSVEALKAWLESVESSPIKVYAAKDTKGQGMDCLKIVQIGKSDYLGVCHSMDGKGVFSLRLVRSKDLVRWDPVHQFDPHSHQGTLFSLEGKWLMAFERDTPNGNHIVVRGYNSLKDLLAGRHAVHQDLPPQLSKFAEGTPSIDFASTYGDSWEDVDVQLRLHYYRDGDVDRQASGNLKGFADWQSRVERADHAPLEKTYKGNIGDRDSVYPKGVKFDLLEAQLAKNDWSSWRILMRRRGDEWLRVSPRTKGGSRSFANPNWTAINLPNGKAGLVVTYFLPSQGSAPGESGTLIYAKPRPW